MTYLRSYEHHGFATVHSLKNKGAVTCPGKSAPDNLRDFGLF